MRRPNEALGFLCRWVLLGLMAGSAVGTAWVVTTASSTEDAPVTSILLTDEVWAKGYVPQSNGWLEPAPRHIGFWHLLGGPEAGRRSCALHVNGWVEVQIQQPAQSDVVVVVEGLPYGPMGFVHARAPLRVVPEGSRLALVDGRMPADAVRRAMEQADGAYVVLVHGGPADRYAADRERLRRAGIKAPVVWRAGEKQDWSGTLRRVTARTGSPADRLHLWSDDPALVRLAEDMGIVAGPASGATQPVP